MAPLGDKLYGTGVAVLTAIAATAFAVLLWPHPRPVVETAKPAVVPSDNSIILERTDTQPSVKPVHQIPKGARLERKMSVTMAPKIAVANGIRSGLAPEMSDMSKPSTLTVDLSMIREKDDTRRVIVSSPDGEIVGGLDIPVETLAYKPRVWAAGISVDPVHQVGGVWIERDISRIRLGAEVGANRYHDFETRLKVGVTW